MRRAARTSLRGARTRQDVDVADEIEPANTCSIHSVAGNDFSTSLGRPYNVSNRRLTDVDTTS